MANKRQGTAKSKQRNEVSYSTKKIRKQKGGGGARAGSRKSPLFVGGGRVFGPQPRDYSFKLNKKVKRLARISALTYKAKDNNITVLENFSFEAPKTKSFTEMLSKLAVTGKKVLLVTSSADKNIYLSARNLQRSKVVTATDLNTYDILNSNKLILTEDSIPVIENILNK
jgi:large subunit ribosomal protein L4